MNFWELMIKKDDIILSFIEGIRKLIYATDRQIQKARKEMAKRPIEGIGKELYLLLNAPSLKTQDISVLKGKNTMFVNRGFMHPLYKELQPQYHVFVDSKMLKGIWPISWLDEIWNMSPNTTIILPISWYTHPLFKNYQNVIIYYLHQK